MKRIFAAVTAIIIIISMFSGCGGQTSTQSTESPVFSLTFDGNREHLRQNYRNEVFRRLETGEEFDMQWSYHYTLTVELNGTTCYLYTDNDENICIARPEGNFDSWVDKPLGNLHSDYFDDCIIAKDNYMSLVYNDIGNVVEIHQFGRAVEKKYVSGEYKGYSSSLGGYLFENKDTLYLVKLYEDDMKLTKEEFSSNELPT